MHIFFTQLYLHSKKHNVISFHIEEIHTPEQFFKITTAGIRTGEVYEWFNHILHQLSIYIKT